ncbi:hypothetical protein ACVCGS_20875 [Klebsiella pneumoniae]
MRTINNTPLPMPVTQGQLAYKPLQPGENPAISDGLKMGIQSAKFAFDGEGLSHITYRFRTVDDPSGTWFSKFGVYVATWAGSAWSEQQIAYVPPERGTLLQHWRQPFRGQTEGVFFGGIHVFREYCRCHCPGGKCRFWMGLLGTRQQRPHTSAPGSAPGNGGDVLYVSAPFEAKVYRYFVPEDYSPAQQFTSFDVLLSTLV